MNLRYAYVRAAVLCFGVVAGDARCCGSLAAADSPVTALAFVPDGRAAVVGSQAGLELRSWPELERLRAIDVDLTQIHDLAFSPDGRRLLVAGGSPTEEGVAVVVKWPEGTVLQRITTREDVVYSVAWQDDASTFATAGLDRSVTLYDATSVKRKRTFEGHSRGVTAVCFVDRDSLLVSAGIDQSLRVWNAGDGTLGRTLANHTQAVHDLAVRPGSNDLPMIASVSDDRTVRLWQPTIGRMVRFVRLPAVPLAVRWLPDGSHMAVVSTDGLVRLIDPDTVEVVAEQPAVKGWAYSLAVHPKSGDVLVGGQAGQLQRVVLKPR